MTRGAGLRQAQPERDDGGEGLRQAQPERFFLGEAPFGLSLSKPRADPFGLSLSKPRPDLRYNRPMSSAPDLPFSPAAERNAAPILAALAARLPARCRVLEIASGTGQHAAQFALAQPGWHWQPTDADPQALPGIAARCAALPNVAAPLRLDVQARWPAELGRFDALYCANMLHISPWASCAALMEGAAAHLESGGRLVVYGPFIVDGEALAPSNAAFDASLNARDPAWGLRRLGDVQAQARAAGLVFEERVAMPANNLLLVWRVSAPPSQPR